MTITAAVLHDRRSPTPGPLARPLSEPIAALLRDGDTDGRYTSRSEAVMATALAAASAGWTETAWRDVLQSSALADWATQQRRKGGALRQRNPADAHHRLTTTWKAAVRRAHERPAVADAPSVRAELAALLAAADHNPALWAGAAGVTDRAVLAALVDIALAAVTLTPSASTRQLGERANISHSTAAVALDRLVTRGWLRREQPANGTLAATWRLVRPANVPAPPREVDELLEALPPAPSLQPEAAPAPRTPSRTPSTAASAASPRASSTPSTTARTAASPSTSSPRSPDCTPAPSSGTSLPSKRRTSPPAVAADAPGRAACAPATLISWLRPSTPPPRASAAPAPPPAAPPGTPPSARPTPPTGPTSPTGAAGRCNAGSTGPTSRHSPYSKSLTTTPRRLARTQLRPETAPATWRAVRACPGRLAQPHTRCWGALP